MAVTIFLLYDYRRSSMESEMALESLRALERKPVAGTEVKDAVVSGGIPLIGMETDDVSQTENPYGGVFEEYPDIKGWLCVEGTAVDYPVLQRAGCWMSTFRILPYCITQRLEELFLAGELDEYTKQAICEHSRFST